MHDKYTDKALSEGLRARSAYKLLQINNKYHIIKRNDNILDLGCWPGGWMIAAKRIGANKVLGIDLAEIEPIENTEFIQGSVLENKTIAKIQGAFEVILSDLAPKTSGNRSLDVARSLDLSETAFKMAKKHLKVNGNLLIKVFQGEGYQEFFNKITKHFTFTKTVKPEASRQRSMEVYLLGIGFKG
ncbi:MAG: RlmE family RNA methyltransferase [Nanoarchaeota archaeon]|nr:RlmE family RNA methyltransferase [Nanoarchaeota archaeon]